MSFLITECVWGSKEKAVIGYVGPPVYAHRTCDTSGTNQIRDPMKVLPVPLRYGPIKTVSLGLECDEVLKQDLSELLCLLTQEVGWNCT